MNLCKLFADDTKILSIVNDFEDGMILQSDLDRMTEWNSKWGMVLNVKKCKVMHFGRSNPRVDYYLTDPRSGTRHKLETTESERDLGIIIASDLKQNDQVCKAAARANSILGRLLKAFTYKTPSLIRDLFCAFVRPHLEFAVSAWCPHFKKDIEILEKVQRRALRAIPQFNGLNYQQKLDRLGLSTLESRRTRGDLIQLYKISTARNDMKWYSNVGKSVQGMESNTERAPIAITRGHHMKYEREYVPNYEPRHYFLLNRIASAWNYLPPHVVNAPSVEAFKERLDTFNKQRLL